jgi:TolA-binding protein
VSAQLYPGNPEPVNGLADLLVQNGQQDQARQLMQDFARRYPDQQKFLARSPTWILLIGNH